jgi:hypothetical protein
MSIAALAAAATVFDTIEEVARDARVSVPVARSVVTQYGIASVDDSGRVTMSEDQSRRAGNALDIWATAW